MMTRPLFLGITASDALACIEAVLRTGVIGAWPPDQMRGDDGAPIVGPKSLQELRARVDHDFSIDWMKPSRTCASAFISWTRMRWDPSVATLKVENLDVLPNVALTLAFLEQVPFDYCSGSSASYDWITRIDYIGPSFGAGHNPLGWMCAFKGNGHRFLVSRRWLDHGPWRLIRGKDDLSFVQFHDLETDDDTALEQARPGHERMGISSKGGFLPQFLRWDRLLDKATGTLKGLYDASTQSLIQVVMGRQVDREEMAEAAAVKVKQPVGKPVRQVVYVFLDEAQARAQLHQLWLHGLEVRTMIGGREVRIDEDYAPAPEVPDWVKRVQDREGQ